MAVPQKPGGNWRPKDWEDRIRATLAGGLTPVPARRAATVILLRDADTAPAPPPSGDPKAADGGRGTPGLAVHMLRRRTSMAFAGGMYAYPGGSVDPRDEHAELNWAGPDAEEWAKSLGCPSEVAQAVVCAAVRETFEEAGVLLAGPDADSVVADVTGADWEADRAALVAHDLAFSDFLTRRGLVLRSDLLGGWARWITPEHEPRRYDTWFFVCALPPGQRARDLSGEADRTEWILPAQALARYDRGELAMLPPTVATLRRLAPYRSVAEVLAAAPGQDLAPVLARASREGGRIVVVFPGHEEFTISFRDTE